MASSSSCDTISRSAEALTTSRSSSSLGGGRRQSSLDDGYSSSTDSIPVAHSIEYDMKGSHRTPQHNDDGETDSDKDLVITSLTESLQIHKEIMERLHAEKEAFIERMKQERENEREMTRKEKEAAQKAMEEQMEQYQKLEEAYSTIVKELETKKQEYQRLESNFYAHVRSIRPTDDDLSTIQYEISHLSNQLNNFCMGLKSKMDRSGGTAFILERWRDKEADIRQQFFKTDSDDERLEPGVITMFTEKFVMEVLVERIFSQPIHPGVSVNKTFDDLRTWMGMRNDAWAHRLRQQVTALVVKQPGDEQKNIDDALASVVEYILETLTQMYPRIREGTSNQKKVEGIVARAAKLDLAMKGQDIKVFCASIEEGVAPFDEKIMQPVGKSDPDGTVLFVVSPPFVALDPKDDEHGFIIPGKVFTKRE